MSSRNNRGYSANAGYIILGGGPADALPGARAQTDSEALVEESTGGEGGGRTARSGLVWDQTDRSPTNKHIEP